MAGQQVERVTGGNVPACISVRVISVRLGKRLRCCAGGRGVYGGGGSGIADNIAPTSGPTTVPEQLPRQKAAACSDSRTPIILSIRSIAPYDASNCGCQFCLAFASDGWRQAAASSKTPRTSIVA